MKLAAGLVGILLAACGNATTPAQSTKTIAPASASASSTPAPSGSSHIYGVFVKDFLLGPNGYDVLLVKADGSVAAVAHAQNRSFKSRGLVDLPVVSNTQSHVYYLDGDADIRYLLPDGTTRFVERLPVTNQQLAAFAVSPDEKRLAFSVLDYSTNPVTMSLFTEDLGGANRNEIFSSKSVYEWPVGWHRGGLIVAVNPLSYVQNAGDWFMASFGFHVVDPATANRLVTICDTSSAYAAYPTSPWGAACLAYPQEYSVVSWEGQKRELLPGDPCRAQGAIAISPDGSEVAILGLARICGGAANDPAAPIKIADLGSGAVSLVNTSGFFAGTLPGGLSAFGDEETSAALIAAMVHAARQLS